MMIILIQLCMLSIFLKLIRRSSNIWGVGQRLFRSQMATASCVTHSSSFFRNSTRWNFFQQTKTCCMFFDKPKLIESFLTNQNWLKVFCQIKTRWKFFEKLKLVEIFSTKPKTCWKFSKKAKFVESFLTNQNSLKVFRQIKTRWKFFWQSKTCFFLAELLLAGVRVGRRQNRQVWIHFIKIFIFILVTKQFILVMLTWKMIIVMTTMILMTIDNNTGEKISELYIVKVQGGRCIDIDFQVFYDNH